MSEHPEIDGHGAGKVRIGIELDGEKRYTVLEFSEPWTLPDLQVAVSLAVTNIYHEAREKK